ncbi:interferon-induced GTP-binding protein Mx2 [Zopfia rhizophila CBS 207.26]|uniref:Interferon-induced GTP-binding protein Mx2 n=1 Tax=Zopfia rhizophila CBS 207.26 TaxID=1314779 RepID=A0A6A6DUY6_9PEZI|nr:interferon-induced GTP-binding protein Mx2 [Zopfia rhizophila CBS 207.26]
MAENDRPGLANQALLNKIDKLRELNVKSIELPQLVIVGDQSSGKSSVLKSLTGFSFPQAPGLCTRYVTLISCRHAPEKHVVVSIIPRSDADKAVEGRLRAFKRSISNLMNKALVRIIEEANKVIGIRMTADDTDSSLQTFSEDILNIEISGPEQEYFTVINIPGIFRVPSPPLTTDSDIALVRNMVQSYIENSRTIILAVLPSNVDISTQEILKMAENADPEGILAQEKTFFNGSTWRQVAASRRCGIRSLKNRLSDLLMNISKKEFPHIKADSIRPSHTEQTSQRIFLRKMGSKFQAITQCALNRYYDSKIIFTEVPSLKLITKITKMNEKFANDFWKKGHKQHFSANWDDEGEKIYKLTENNNNSTPFEDLLQNYPELHDIINTDNYQCLKLKAFNDDSIMDYIERVYQSNRGPELGTFSGSILAATFREQSEKWEPLVLTHVSKSIALVHDYIFKLLVYIYPDKQVRDQLWETLLINELRKAYVRAMEQARFLLRIKQEGRPSTYNHYFSSEVQKKRQDRMTAAIADKSDTHYTHDNKPIDVIPVTGLRTVVVNKDNAQQVREDILDILASYYRVSRKCFVDVICKQVISHFLLEGDESPLKIFRPELVMGLDDEQLETIAGEDEETKRQRSMLESEIKNLEAATKVLRG